MKPNPENHVRAAVAAASAAAAVVVVVAVVAAATAEVVAAEAGDRVIDSFDHVDYQIMLQVARSTWSVFVGCELSGAPESREKCRHPTPKATSLSLLRID